MKIDRVTQYVFNKNFEWLLDLIFLEECDKTEEQLVEVSPCLGIPILQLVQLLNNYAKFVIQKVKI